MQSSWSASPDPAGAEDRPDVVRRFVEASRRAEIIALVNSAGSDREVARATVDELCEALEAELAFVVVTRPDRGERETIGHIGLTPVAGGRGGRPTPLTRAAFGTRAAAGPRRRGPARPRRPPPRPLPLDGRAAAARW